MEKIFFRFLMRAGVSLFIFFLFPLACHSQDLSEEEIDRKLDFLENRLSAGSEELDELKSQIKNLEKENKVLSSQVEKKSRFISQLQKDLIVRGKEAPVTASGSPSISISQKEKIIQALEKAQAKMRQLKELNLALYEKLKEKETQIAQLQEDQPQKYVKLKEKLNQMKSQIRERDREIKNLRNDLASGRLKYEKEFAAKLKEKDERISFLEREQTRANPELKKQLAEKNKEIESLRLDLSRKIESADKELSFQLKEKDEKISALEKSLKDKNADLARELDQRETQVRELRRNLLEEKELYEKMLAEKKEDVTEICAEEESFVDKTADMVKLKRELAKKEKEIEELIIKHDKEKRQISENIASFQKRIEDQDRQITRLKRKKGIVAGKSVSSQGREREKLDLEIARLKKENVSLSRRLDQARGLERVLEKKEKDLAALRRDNQNLAAQAEKVSVSIDNVSTDREVARLSRELKIKNELLDNLKNNYFQSSEKRRQEIETLKREIASLKKQASLSTASLPQYRKDTSALEQENKDLESALRYSEQTVKQLQSEISQKEAYLQALRGSRSRESELNMEGSRLHSELQDSQNTVFKLRSVLEDKDAEIEHLRKTMERVLTYMDALGDTSGIPE